jgi:hypothetical protein
MGMLTLVVVTVELLMQSHIKAILTTHSLLDDWSRARVELRDFLQPQQFIKFEPPS